MFVKIINRYYKVVKLFLLGVNKNITGFLPFLDQALSLKLISQQPLGQEQPNLYTRFVLWFHIIILINQKAVVTKTQMHLFS